MWSSEQEGVQLIRPIVVFKASPISPQFSAIVVQARVCKQRREFISMIAARR